MTPGITEMLTFTVIWKWTLLTKLGCYKQRLLHNIEAVQTRLATAICAHSKAEYSAQNTIVIV